MKLKVESQLTVSEPLSRCVKAVCECLTNSADWYFTLTDISYITQLTSKTLNPYACVGSHKTWVKIEISAE